MLDALLKWSLLFGFGIACLFGLLTYQKDPADLGRAPFVVALLGYSVVVVVGLGRGLPYRLRAFGFALALWLAASGAVLTLGQGAAASLTLALAVVVAGLFLNTRAMLLMLILTTSSIAVATWLGADPRPGETVGRPLTGLARALSYALVTGAIAVLVSNIVRRIESTLAHSEQALAELQREQARRNEAQVALQETEAALARSQKLEAVGRLAAGVGHDFNNSLQVIFSWVDLMRGSEEQSIQRQGLEAIDRAAQQGSELTRRLLAFGRRDLRAPVPMSPAHALTELANSLRRLLPEDISIELELGPVPDVLADPAQLDHVLLNLGVNARDAMPAGGTLQLGCRRVSRSELPPELSHGDGETWAELWVRDTGVGMDPETQAHIFEPFFTTKGEQGTGLGLASAYAVIRQNRGGMTVRSAPGEGATFFVYLPESTGQATSIRASSRAPAVTSSRCVMLAEDDPGVRAGLVAALERAGFSVLEAPDARVAENVLQHTEQRIDVLCTDGIMPGGGTKRLIEQFLRRHPKGQVILCSGYIEEELLRRDVDAGVFTYLPKPFTPTALIERISGLLAESTRSSPS